MGLSLRTGWPWQTPAQEVLPERTMPGISLEAWADMLSSFVYQGLNYTYPSSTQEDIGQQ